MRAPRDIPLYWYLEAALAHRRALHSCFAARRALQLSRRRCGAVDDTAARRAEVFRSCSAARATRHALRVARAALQPGRAAGSTLAILEVGSVAEAAGGEQEGALMRQLRARIRAGDLIGQLAPGRFVVLLARATPREADLVAGRLTRLLGLTVEVALAAYGDDAEAALLRLHQWRPPDLGAPGGS